MIFKGILNMEKSEIDVKAIATVNSRFAITM
jgi:hypothetical protein